MWNSGVPLEKLRKDCCDNVSGWLWRSNFKMTPNPKARFESMTCRALVLQLESRGMKLRVEVLPWVAVKELKLSYNNMSI